MRLGLILLDNVIDVNHFSTPSEVHVVQGNNTRLYFMLVNESVYGSAASRTRWIPSDVAALSVNFSHVDSNAAITNRSATMAFSDDDRSIWFVDIGANESIAADSLEATLTDGLVVTKLAFLGTLRSDTVSGGLGRFYC
jgi:hypothetical protein